MNTDSAAPQGQQHNSGNLQEVLDSAANADQQAWPAFIERGFDGYRAYYDYLPKGKLSVEYTVRLNNVGTFGLPPTRVEALYAPSTFGALPNAPFVVVPAAGTGTAAAASR